MSNNFYLKMPKCEEPCPHCDQDPLLHIGKSSSGWRFLARAYERLPYGARGDTGLIWVMNRPDWVKLVKSGQIVDEVGREYTAAEFLDLVDSKQDGIAHKPYMASHHPQDTDHFTSEGYDFLKVEFC